MGANVTPNLVDGAPGNTLTLVGTGLIPGAAASVTLNNQGVLASPYLVPQTITLPAIFETTSVIVGPLPDGVVNGTLTITAGDETSDTCALRAVSQYVQSFEYIGEGLETYAAALPAGVLDATLRRASTVCDSFMTGSLRQLQTLERHRYKARPNGAPLIFPYRPRGRRFQIKSIDQLTFISASDLVTTFNPGDMYVNQDDNYIEMLAYAVGNYALIGQLQIIGYSANVLELSYTTGYASAEYPYEVRAATLLTATMLLNRYIRNSIGMGPFHSFEKTLVVDDKAVRLPPDAKSLLAPYVGSALA